LDELNGRKQTLPQQFMGKIAQKQLPIARLAVYFPIFINLSQQGDQFV